MTSLSIPLQEIQRRLALDNPWWQAGRGIETEEATWPRRSYFGPFVRLASDRTVRRAVVLVGPRRVGKTVMLRQFIQELLDTGTRGIDILFVSLDTPLYSGLSLENLVELFIDLQGHSVQGHTVQAPNDSRPLWVIFDEIQYLKDWSVHLKSLVDTYPSIRFRASGSAAAALKMKSVESGVGRFTDFFLPPLTFAEFLEFTQREQALIVPVEQPGPAGIRYRSSDIYGLNREFINYVNYGGFPEAAMNPSVRSNPYRFLRQDIVDKVLLKDLPSLYGISDTQLLNRFFNVLAYNTGLEIRTDTLSEHSDISRQKLTDFIEYLEASYLVKRLFRIDQNAQRLQRVTSFKVYLTNPSMRAALFGPVSEDDEAMGSMAETAVWSQWLHQQGMSDFLCYARWTEGRKKREVDIVKMDQFQQKPIGAVEVKWSDRILHHPEELAGTVELASKYNLGQKVVVTTRSETDELNIAGTKISCIPTALFCYLLGKTMDVDAP